MNIYVANLDYDLNEAELEGYFSQYGDVSSVKIIYDRVTRRSRGFGFVEMATEEAGLNAIEGLNGTEVRGREISVSKAKPPKPRF
ncbi:MAG: RNA-binding protein [Saprospiraceae bacterium]|nr:RNA-binding protein [Saprospiraceae bacterium]